MAVFPTGFTDRTPSRTSKLLGDTGLANGNFTVAQLLDLIQLNDLPPGTTVDDTLRWDGSNWVFHNPPEIQELTAGGAIGDTNLFSANQGGAGPVRVSANALFTYMLAKFFASDAVIEDVPAATLSYTFQAADKNKIKRFNATSAANVFLPAGYSPGTTFGWIQQGGGTLTFSTLLNAGQTIQSASGSKSGGQFARGSLVCVAANTWNLSGYTQA